MNLDLSVKHILIVDDKPTNLKVLAQALTNAKYDIAIANSGEMAIQMSLEDPPELILLDILMPKMDGYETFEKIKQNSVTKDIPVIFMSALSDTVNKIKGLSLGAADYITKPFEAKEVLARVNTQLQMRSLRKALEQKNQELSEALKRLQNSQAKLIVQERLAVIGSLTSGIVHELRNPLNFIQNYGEGSIELIEDLTEEIDKQEDNIKPDELNYIRELIEELRRNSVTITSHSKRAENVIQDMLMQSRTENQKNRQQTKLHSLIDKALSLVTKSNHYLLNLKLEKNYAPEIGTIKVIREQISRVFINLFDNACYALQEKQEQLNAENKSFSPLLLIKTQKIENAIEISIKDNGIGMPKEILDKIFHPFFSTKPNDKGTGLGLSLSRDIIVNNHHGKIIINSEPNNFTEVKIYLYEKQLNLL